MATVIHPPTGAMMRARDTLRTTVGTAAVAGLCGVLLWASDKAPSWLAPALTAVITGVLVEKLVEVFRRRSPERDPDPPEPNPRLTEAEPPFACHVKLDQANFFQVAAQGNEPERMVPASGFILRLTVTALSGRTVVLSALRPVVLERHTPRGVFNPHAGIVPPRRYTVLLDEDPPRLESREADGHPFSYKVSPDDPEVFELLVQTERWYVVWTLELDWVSEDRQGTAVIDLAGHPFRTMARPPRSLHWRTA
ncbi:hypothetical protein [Streptomyces guryensis]|uniref:Uncharacterized protein n=1 Tax=Streptomyces guryensis TaxID=2886947 RepID=A0A9Q3Z4H4_9ACTN|nr:hypothetical protein [Streptomyces guryensis]MCD9872864.1 hypothetical protein [Streptomyces guryensis]